MKDALNNLKQIIKSAMKVIRKLIDIKFVIIVAVIVFFIMLIPLMWYAKENQTAETSTKSGEKISSSTSATPNVETGEIEIKDDLYSEIREEYTEEGIYLSSYCLDDRKYLENEYTYLEKMVQAEVVSSSIDTGVGDIRGIVKVNRKSVNSNGDETEIQLQYQTPINFENTYNAAKQSGDVTELLKYFTINQNNELIIPFYEQKTTTNSNGTTTETIIEKGTFDYKSTILQFTMPYEFLFVLLQVTRNPEYVTAVADLAMDGEIVLTVFDNKDTFTEETVSSYDKIVEEKKSDWWLEGAKLNEDLIFDEPDENNVQHVKKIYMDQDNEETEETCSKTTSEPIEEKGENTTVKTEVHEITIAPTKVNTWIYNKDLQYKLIENPDEIRTYTNLLQASAKPIATQTETTTSSKKFEDNKVRYQTSIKETRKENEKDTITSTYKSCTWNKQEEQTQDNNMINVDVFLGLWKNNSGNYIKWKNSEGEVNQEALYNSEGKEVYYKSPEEPWLKLSPAEYICETPSFLFDFLQQSSRTAGYEKIMKYVIGIYSNKNYQISKEDIEELAETFEVSNLNATSGAESSIGYISGEPGKLGKTTITYDGREYEQKTYTSEISGRTYILYKQNNYSGGTAAPWRNLPANGSSQGTIAARGCMVTSLACIMTGYGKNVTPWGYNGGVSVESECQERGLKGFPINKSEIVNYLRRGYPVMIDVGKGYFTNSQHKMALLDIKGEGELIEVYVGNPGSASIEKNGWMSFDFVTEDLKGAWCVTE